MFLLKSKVNRLCVHACMLSRFSHVWLFATLWTSLGALQAPLSMGFSRQEYWGGLPCPPPGHLPDPGTELASLKSSALGSLPLTPAGKLVVRTHISPFFGFPSFLGHHRALSKFLKLYSWFSLVIYFRYNINSVYTSTPNSQFIPPNALPPLVSLCLFSGSVSLFLICK